MTLVRHGQALFVVGLGRDLEDERGRRLAVCVVEPRRLQSRRRIERDADHRHAASAAEQHRRAMIVEDYAGLVGRRRTQVDERDAARHTALERQRAILPGLRGRREEQHGAACGTWQGRDAPAHRHPGFRRGCALSGASGVVDVTVAASEPRQSRTSRVAPGAVSAASRSTRPVPVMTMA